jgi:hypothetical protein
MRTKEETLAELRVAKSELLTGNTNGNVYLQVSPGAALVLTDRTVAINQVSHQIQALMNAGNVNEKIPQKGKKVKNMINTGDE